MARLFRLVLTVLVCSNAPQALAQDLASQLLNSLSEPQRTFFESLSDENGVPRLTGGYGGALGLQAVLRDNDYAFVEGQQISWQLTSPVAGQLYLFDIGAGGGARLITPNAFGPPVRLDPGVPRVVPQAIDGVTVFMDARSDTQIWFALVLDTGQDWQPAMSGDPRLGEVEGGAAGLSAQVRRLISSGQGFGFALTVFGRGTPPLAPEIVEQTLGLTQEVSAQVQQALNDKGFNVGDVDGMFGSNTRKGLSDWQSSLGQNPTGYLNAYSLQELLAPIS